MNSARLINLTNDAEKNICYVARVSNPDNQEKENYKLLDYCIRERHWSVFEQADMTVEVITSRAISAQILRHRSFCFQEFSGRYQDVTKIGNLQVPELRKQDVKNRQNSTNDLNVVVKKDFERRISYLFDEAEDLYREMLDAGIAKECARMILPLNSPTKIYIKGNIRSWIHYIDLREKNGTQKEHMEVAKACKEIFVDQLPIISKALDWT